VKLLTESRMKDARACQRLHHLKYDLGYRPVREDDVLRFGSLVHRGEEAWWLHQNGGEDPLEAALQAMAGEADPFERAKAEVMMVGYDARWRGEPYEVIAVEAKFEAPLINPATGAPSRTWRLAGKLDVLVRDLRDRLRKLVEHKTSSEDVRPGSEYWRRLRMDGQVSTYFDGAGALGSGDVVACIYDVLSKPALRPSQVPLVGEAGVKIVLDAGGGRVRTKDGKKWRETGDAAQGYVLQTRDETPEEFRARLTEAVAADPDRYFARGEVVRLEKELDEARFDRWQLGQQIREAEVAGRFPRNPDACVRYGRTCPYFPICTGEASLDDPTMFRRVEDVHPELAEADNAPAA